MIALTMLLAGVGVADAVAGGLAGDAVRRPYAAVAAGVAAAAVTGLLAVLPRTADVPLGSGIVLAAVVAVGTTAAWVVLRRGVGRRSAGVAIAALLAGGVLAALFGDLGGAPERIRGMALLAGAVALVTTGNAVVRTLLTVADPGLAEPSTRLRGGRLIGPLERLLIYGLVLAGAFTAATLVAAAKGLLRFPEVSDLQRVETSPGQPAPDPGPDLVTEYFVVGSLASWTVAFAVGFALA